MCARIGYLFLLSTVVMISACSSSIDPQSVQAKRGAPTAAHVEAVSLSRNQEVPQAYLVVEPVRVRQQGGESVKTLKGGIDVAGASIDGNLSVIKTSYSNYLLQRQRQISLQLTSSLSGVGDFRLIDHQSFIENPKVFQMQRDALGPYYVRAVITECDERIVSDRRKRSLPLVYEGNDALIEGIVGLDVSVVSVSSGEIVAGFPVQGTFVYKSRGQKLGLIANITQSDVRMKSTIDQALRVALNEAALKLHARLYSE